MNKGAAVKAGWPTKTLGEVCDFRGGGTPSKAVDRYWQGDIPWVSPKDMKFDVVSDSIDHISAAAIESSATSLIPEDSVLMVVRSGILARIVPIALTGRALTINQDLKALCPKRTLHARFLYYLLHAKMGVLLSMVSRGATVHRLTTDVIRSVDFLLPPLPEQQRIVGILDEAFDGIATAKANAEKNLQNARALFESHLQSVFTQGAESAVPLSSILSVQPRNGWSPPAEYQTGEGIPVLTLSSVTGFEYDGSRVKLSSAPTRDDAHYWLEKGDLLITRSNTRELVGHVAIYDGTPPRAICCDLIMKCRVNPTKALTRFVYFCLRSPDARSYLTSRAQGASSTMKKIGKPVVQNIPIPLPSLAQQQSTTAKLDALSAETQRLESIYQQKLAALDALKKSLLDQAFTGVL